MEPKSDGWTLVIVGFWNRMIFSPKWVGEGVFQKEELEILVPLSPTIPLVLRDEHLSLQVSDRRLILAPRLGFLRGMEDAEQKALRILERLPETPVSAVGVNFSFLESSPSESLLRLFNHDDDSQLESLRWRIEERTISRKLIQEDSVFNLTLRLDPESQVELRANFDMQVDSAQKAKEILRGKSRACYSQFIEALSSAYQLHVQEQETVECQQPA
ncbi:MAG: hypothetical protein NTW86_17630 [Candidatus Sumerlaeota bacterium]|nr:hypothetical protein [Candidatus Sumerlaeota bacterium]